MKQKEVYGVPAVKVIEVQMEEGFASSIKPDEKIIVGRDTAHKVNIDAFVESDTFDFN